MKVSPALLVLALYSSEIAAINVVEAGNAIIERYNGREPDQFDRMRKDSYGNNLAGECMYNSGKIGRNFGDFIYDLFH